MHKDNCHQDDFNSLITRCRTYLKKTDFENGNLNKIPRNKSFRNNIFLQCKKHSTEFEDKWHIDSENCEKCINLSSNSELPNGKFTRNIILKDYVKIREVKPIGIVLINVSTSVELTCLI